MNFSEYRELLGNKGFSTFIFLLQDYRYKNAWFIRNCAFVLLAMALFWFGFNWILAVMVLVLIQFLYDASRYVRANNHLFSYGLKPYGDTKELFLKFFDSRLLTDEEFKRVEKYLDEKILDANCVRYNMFSKKSVNALLGLGIKLDDFINFTLVK